MCSSNMKKMSMCETQQTEVTWDKKWVRSAQGTKVKTGAGGQFQGFYSGPGRKRVVGGSYSNCRVENEKESMGPTTNGKKVPTDQ